MLAWRAAEAVRDLDGAAASIAAGQAEVRARSLPPSMLSFRVVLCLCCCRCHRFDAVRLQG